MKNRAKLICVCFLILSAILCSCKKEEVPVLTTSEVGDITGTTASCGGTISSEGTGTIVAKGVCWSTDINPSIEDNKTIDGAGAGTFTSVMTDLNGATKYYVRAYATNDAGTGYGMTMLFTTLGQVPSAITQSATNISTTSATLKGIVNANYLSTVVTFEYGTTISYGSTATATQSPVSGNTNTSVSAETSGLTEGTTYHFRVKTVNSLGTSYGDDITFTTLGSAPNASTQPATNITKTSATLNGTVNANYLSTAVTIEYGTTTGYGSYIVTTQSPVTGNLNTIINTNVSNLSAATTYHYRIKAVNSLGTVFGDDVSFTTLPADAIADADGNVYNSVTIGAQIWLKENLKTTKYSNGDVISSGIYVQSEELVDTYGRLYTWDVTVDSRKICPTGWHVPSREEWSVLLTNVTSPAELKESGTSNWFYPNTGATNSVLFTALPGGYYGGSGTVCTAIGAYATFWFTDEASATNGKGFALYYNNPGEEVHYAKNCAFSVRCVKD